MRGTSVVLVWKTWCPWLRASAHRLGLSSGILAQNPREREEVAGQPGEHKTIHGGYLHQAVRDATCLGGGDGRRER